VIAIISLLSSVVLASLSSARASARDTRRASDFDQLRKAVQAYITDNTAYPGVDDSGGVRLSEECAGTDMYQDLVDGGYLQEMPTDPIDDVSSCNDLYQKNDSYFYGWNSDNPGGNDTVFCFGINKFEQAQPDSLDDLDWEPDHSFGPNANLEDAEFVYCFTDWGSTFTP